MKKTYINPNMVVVPFIATHVIANSLNSVTGLEGVDISTNDFTGGAADTKGISDVNLWDNEW